MTIMKKSLICLVALLGLTFGFTSCEKESLGKTKITYYATLELEGDEYIEINKGDAYTEPGFKAVMNGQDVSDKVVVNGEVNPNVAGVYDITYTIVNADGFASSAARQVVVFDAADPIQGHWACTPTSFRTNANTGADVAYGASFEIMIVGNNGDGNYFVDDLLAGWYCQRAGYGTSYAMQAVIAVAADGAISLKNSYVPGWGDAADKLSADSKFDAATNTITYAVTYAGYLIFNVTLIKVD